MDLSRVPCAVSPPPFREGSPHLPPNIFNEVVLRGFCGIVFFLGGEGVMCVVQRDCDLPGELV